MKKLIFGFLTLLANVAGAQTYNQFHPGGDLAGAGSTWNVQFVAPGSITDAKGALAVKPAVTVVATANQALTGTPVLDGQATAAGSIILATAQTAPAENGPWVAAAGAWSRPTWYASGNTTQAFQFITTFVRLGTLYQGTTWRQTAAAPITIDTDATTWVETPFAVNSTSVSNSVTGTGAVVLAASPTLTTPALGTPSALVLTNATGLPDGALSANVPLLNASNSFTGTTQKISSAEPRFLLNETDAGSDLKLWDCDVNAGVLTCRTRTDADGAGVNWLSVTRGPTTAISNISLGNATNNPTFNLLGTGGVTVGGGASFGATVTVTGNTISQRFQVSGSGLPSNGIYGPATNQLGFATNTVARALFDVNGQFIINAGFASAGTKFTASGCSNSTTVGGAIAGKFTSGTTGTCTVTITLPTATNGWTCYASDLTSPVIFTQTANATTSCTISATTVTNDIITFMAMGY